MEHRHGEDLQPMISLNDLTIPAPSAGPLDWNDDGYLVLKNFIPEDLMSEYEECWLEHNVDRPQGWPDCTPYRRHPELLNILSYGGIHETIRELIGENAGVHLNLTGWVSTQRNWHQDTYLNPAHVGDYYVAIWIALDTIHPDSGPFQLVPGSHRWPTVTREKILAALEPSERDHTWPKHSERLLTPLFTAEIERRQAPVYTHLPSRGDILFWHGRTLHRGSSPNVPGMERRSLIAHYSGVNHRQDMPTAMPYRDGWYFPIDDPNA